MTVSLIAALRYVRATSERGYCDPLRVRANAKVYCVSLAEYREVLRETTTEHVRTEVWWLVYERRVASTGGEW